MYLTNTLPAYLSTAMRKVHQYGHPGHKDGKGRIGCVTFYIVILNTYIVHGPRDHPFIKSSSLRGQQTPIPVLLLKQS